MIAFFGWLYVLGAVVVGFGLRDLKPPHEHGSWTRDQAIIGGVIWPYILFRAKKVGDVEEWAGELVEKIDHTFTEE